MAPEEQEKGSLPRGEGMSQPLASFSIGTSFQNLLDTVFHSIPKIIVFLVIIVIGWIVARILARLVDMGLRKVRFDHFVERGMIGQALARSNTDATMLIARIIYYAILLVTLQMAFGVWGPNPISTMLNAVVAWIPKLIVAIIIVVIASAIARVVRDLIISAIGGLSYGRFLASVASVLIIALGVIAALDQVGIAAMVIQPILYTVLLTAGAILAIGIGGGLIKPMQSRWERMLTVAERETNTQVAAYQQGRTDAMRTPQQSREPQTVSGQTTRAQGATGTQGPQSPQGTQGPQGPRGSGRPPGTDPGDWHDPGTRYQ
jgi:hypothetical protein